MWNIRGKKYDLTEFIDKHPGGRMILENCRGHDDLTGTFESYHSMVNMKKIESIMKKYEVVGECEPCKFRFDNDGFYRTIQQRVRKLFENNQNYHCNTWWVIKSAIQMSSFFVSFVLSMYAHSLEIWIRILLAAFSGHMVIQYGFGIMHDASHGALSNKYWINEIHTRIWNSLACWDAQLWYMHHSFRHHAFTGDNRLDPDIIHFKPLIRKVKDEPRFKYWKLIEVYPKLMAIIFVGIFPGMYVGQAFIYNLVWLQKGYIWYMNKPSSYRFSLLECFLKLFTLVSLMYSGSFMVVAAFAIIANITYSMCILPDHDTFETDQNRLTDMKNKDWGEIQVRHSSDFATDNWLVCACFGGINYQIEHHLFPTICHVHYHKIHPIVIQTCKEFNIPFVKHPTFYTAITSVLKNYDHINRNTKND